MEHLITDTVIGAALGSCITLIGMWMSNRYHSQSRKEDREYSIKSDIYMETAENLVVAKQLLMKLPSASQEELDRMSSQDVSTAKLTIVARNETVQAVTELSTAIGARILQLFPKKLPLDNLRNEIQALSSQIDRHFQKQNQMLNEMTAYNLRGDSDARLWKSLQENFDYQSNQIDKLIEERDAKNTDLTRKVKELFIEAMEASIELTELEIRAISCVRSELNMPFDEDHYRETVERTNERMKGEFSKFLVRVPDNA